MATNKQKDTLKRLGIQDREAERVRAKALKEPLPLGASHPDSIWVVIRDREKEPLPEEIQSRKEELHSERERVATTQSEKDAIYAQSTDSFAPIPIDPALLQSEREFQALQLDMRGIQGTNLSFEVSEEEEEGDGDNESDGGSEGVDMEDAGFNEDFRDGTDFISL